MILPQQFAPINRTVLSPAASGQTVGISPAKWFGQCTAAGKVNYLDIAKKEVPNPDKILHTALVCKTATTEFSEFDKKKRETKAATDFYTPPAAHSASAWP